MSQKLKFSAKDTISMALGNRLDRKQATQPRVNWTRLRLQTAGRKMQSVELI